MSYNTPQHERKMLSDIMKRNYALYYRYETFTRALEQAEFPYRLVQHYIKGTGKYKYSWTSEWSSPAALYIQETEAGCPVAGIRQACKVLDQVLSRVDY